MQAIKRRTFDREFKLNAVRLHKTSGQSIQKLSQDLGISSSAYGRWVQAAKADGSDAFPGKGRLLPTDAELAKLRRELSIVREERDILKKACRIFSTPRDKNTTNESTPI